MKVGHVNQVAARSAGRTAAVALVEPLTTTRQPEAEGNDGSGDGRNRRRLASTQSIEDAALALFVERGYDKTTAEDIASAAGVSVRTFFRHFPNGKQAVVLLETRRHVDILERALRNRPPQESALTAMRSAVRDAASEVRSDDARYGPRDALRIYNQIAAGQPDLIATIMGARQLMMESLVGPIALRMSVDPDTDVRPRALVHSVHAAITVGWLIALRNSDVDVPELVEAALDVFERGIADSMAPPSRL
jgi:AcrR family transcriptional regulator